MVWLSLESELGVFLSLDPQAAAGCAVDPGYKLCLESDNFRSRWGAGLSGRWGGTPFFRLLWYRLKALDKVCLDSQVISRLVLFCLLVLAIESRALSMPSRCPTTELHP